MMKHPAIPTRNPAITIELAGNAASGKTALINRFLGQAFRKEYIQSRKDIEGAQINISLNGNLFTVSIHESMSPAKQSPKDLDVKVFVFDITDVKSFKDLILFTNLAEGKFIPIIVGNKNDLDATREVSTAEALQFAQSVHAHYIETSAKNNTNIDALFFSAIQLVDAMRHPNGRSLRVTSNIPSYRPSKDSEKLKSSCPADVIEFTHQLEQITNPEIEFLTEAHCEFSNRLLPNQYQRYRLRQIIQSCDIFESEFVKNLGLLINQWHKMKLTDESIIFIDNDTLSDHEMNLDTYQRALLLENNTRFLTSETLVFSVGDNIIPEKQVMLLNTLPRLIAAALSVSRATTLKFVLPNYKDNPWFANPQFSTKIALIANLFCLQLEIQVIPNEQSIDLDDHCLCIPAQNEAVYNLTKLQLVSGSVYWPMLSLVCDMNRRLPSFPLVVEQINIAQSPRDLNQCKQKLDDMTAEFERGKKFTFNNIHRARLLIFAKQISNPSPVSGDFHDLIKEYFYSITIVSTTFGSQAAMMRFFSAPILVESINKIRQREFLTGEQIHYISEMFRTRSDLLFPFGTVFEQNLCQWLSDSAKKMQLSSAETLVLLKHFPENGHIGALLVTLFRESLLEASKMPNQSEIKRLITNCLCKFILIESNSDKMERQRMQLFVTLLGSAQNHPRYYLLKLQHTLECLMASNHQKSVEAFFALLNKPLDANDNDQNYFSTLALANILANLINVAKIPERYSNLPFELNLQDQKVVDQYISKYLLAYFDETLNLALNDQDLEQFNNILIFFKAAQLINLRNIPCPAKYTLPQKQLIVKALEYILNSIRSVTSPYNDTDFEFHAQLIETFMPQFLTWEEITKQVLSFSQFDRRYSRRLADRMFHILTEPKQQSEQQNEYLNRVACTLALDQYTQLNHEQFGRYLILMGQSFNIREDFDNYIVANPEEYLKALLLVRDQLHALGLKESFDFRAQIEAFTEKVSPSTSNTF